MCFFIKNIDFILIPVLHHSKKHRWKRQYKFMERLFEAFLLEFIENHQQEEMGRWYGLFQPFARPLHLGFDGVDRNVEFAGHFFVGIFFHDNQFEDDFLL